MLFFTEYNTQSQNMGYQGYSMNSQNGFNGNPCFKCPCQQKLQQPECPYKKYNCPCRQKQEYRFVLQGKIVLVEKPKCPFWNF